MTESPKLLVVELWGLGDLTFASPVLQKFLARGEVHLVGKPYATSLLRPSFPSLRFTSFEAPWTRYVGKYRLLHWNWAELFRTIRHLRREKFDAAISVRSDPRDHLFMWLTGARRRYGYPTAGSRIFLTHPLSRRRAKQHRVEDWREIGRALDLPEMDTAEPRLAHSQYATASVDAIFRAVHKPVLCLHTGARIGVRRWPEKHFARIVSHLRRHFDFHLLLIPDPDGFGSDLAPLADTFVEKLTVGELIDVLGRSDLLLCNDSGPAHLAASCGRPVIAIFGPSDPDCFRPWGRDHHVVIRDICPWRPCFDYCKFLEPHCMTKLLPDLVWPEIHEHIRHLIARGVVTDRLHKPVAA